MLLGNSRPSHDLLWKQDVEMMMMMIMRFLQYSICGKIRGGQLCTFNVFLTKPVWGR